MARIFLSHSSSDKLFVKKLAQDLTSQSHFVWLDEWEIRVGECIPTRIEQGLQETDFVVLVMSKRSCSSAWVEREWKTKYWEEINSRQVKILPILLEECEIPLLLRTKHYADFRTDYEVGLVEILAALVPSDTIRAPSADREEHGKVQLDLLTAIQARQQPLSTIFVDVLRHAKQLADPALVEFARLEISGYPATPGELALDESPATELMHRRISGYISANEINPMYMGWSGGMAPALSYMRQDDDFKPFTIIYTDPIAQIETNLLASSNQKLLSMRIALSLILGKPSDTMLNFYSAGDTFADMYERIRLLSIKHLTSISPK
jgi:hypothetical protein